MENTTNDTPMPVEPTPDAAPAPAPSTAITPTAAPAAAPAPAPMPSQTMGSVDGPNGPMPPELNHWNWGAFFLNWIWGIAHNVWIALLMFVPFVNFIMWIYLGVKGNELAWKHRKFESVDQFKQVQRMWMNWGIGIFVASVLITIFSWSLMFSFLFGAMLHDSSSSTDSSTTTQDYNLNTNFQ